MLGNKHGSKLWLGLSSSIQTEELEEQSSNISQVSPSEFHGAYF